MARDRAGAAVAEASWPVPADGALPEKGYQLVDSQGRTALVWRESERWVVAAEDVSFRQRVEQALSQPLWVRERAVDADEVSYSYSVQLHPNDPRYPFRLPGNWHQLRLDDVTVKVVPLHDNVRDDSTDGGF